MENFSHEIIDEAKRSLEDSGVDVDDYKDLLILLDVLLQAFGQNEFFKNGQGQDARVLASNLVSNRTLLTLLKQQSAELDTLRKLSLNLTSSLDMPTVLDAIVREAMQLVENALAVHIFLYRNGLLHFGAGRQADGNTNMISPPRKDGLTYNVVHEKRIIIVEDMRTHPLYASAPKDWNGSIIGIPLKMGEDVLGVMNLSRSTIGGFTESETRLLGLLAEQAAVAISNASLHQLISHKAYSDTVTGLPNRRALDERIEREIQNARRMDQTFGLVMIDMDGFKNVNDTYGHDTGDQVLRLFFNYMSQGLRASDFLARYGGDELTLVMSNTNLQAAVLVAEKIQARVKKFFFLTPDGRKIHLGASGGIAIYPTHGQTSSDLLRAADEALYYAKRHQRGQFLVARLGTGPLNPMNYPQTNE